MMRRTFDVAPMLACGYVVCRVQTAAGEVQRSSDRADVKPAASPHHLTSKHTLMTTGIPDLCRTVTTTIVSHAGNSLSYVQLQRADLPHLLYCT